MPIHLDDVDVIPEVAGVRSALIVPCNMCPAVTVAVREGKPFIQLFKSFLKSAPFERHITALQFRLGAAGVSSEVFRSDLPHDWFACMWPSRRRNKLRRQAQQYDAAIVLGCDTATKTVRDSLESTGCKVIEGMEVVGFMNAKLKVRWPCDITFEDCKVIPMSQRGHEDDMSG
jgi:hypothetical protein